VLIWYGFCFQPTGRRVKSFSSPIKFSVHRSNFVIMVLCMRHIIAIVFLVVFVNLACNGSRQQETTSVLSNKLQIEHLDCFDQRFRFFDKEWQFADLIGQGAYGKVYALADEDGVVSDELVAKVFYRIDQESVVKHLKEEVLLSRAFPDHFVATGVAKYFSFKNNFGSTVYAGILVKERIHGVNLVELIETSASKFLGSKKDILKAYESLEEFKQELSEQMLKQSSKKIFMGDLNPNNLMYDGENWAIVDATHFDSKSSILSYLDQPGLDGHDVNFLIARLETSKMPLDADVFNTWIDVQLGGPYDELQRRYNKAVQ